MTRPLVSVLIPVYNRELLVGDCIQSALDQTMGDLEVIIADNASTDNTWAVCQQYAKLDSRVKIFRNETNLGPVRNWMRCINEAKGQFGKILFSDDLIAPQFLEKTLPLIESDEVGFIFTTTCVGQALWQGEIVYRFMDATGLVSSKEFINAVLFRNKPVPTSPGCALFRLGDLRNNLKLEIPSPSIHDFPRHGAGPDLLCYLLTAKDYPFIGFVNESLCFFRAHAGSITTSDKEGYLGRCYDQAMIWFASRYLDEETRQRYYSRVWYKAISRRRRWLSSSDVFSQYLDTQPIIGFRDILNIVKQKLCR